jgi:DNA-damage-inducible protein D
MDDLDKFYQKNFEEIKHTRDNGFEFWTARELAPVLGYKRWESFPSVIDKAMLACKNSGVNVADHFREVPKMVEMPIGEEFAARGFRDVPKSPQKTKIRSILDYELSRYACYLIVQNGDPRKTVIAFGQTYFAVQTRRQEETDNYANLDENNKRIMLRNDIKQWNMLLGEAAFKSGVITDVEYAQFQNAGYVGLYGGETVADIHKRKGLERNQKILDFMSSPELIANLFRISQAQEKLTNEKIQGADEASAAHHFVGKEVRETIKKIGGTLPENMPRPAKGVDQVSREEIKKLKNKRLMLDE